MYGICCIYTKKGVAFVEMQHLIGRGRRVGKLCPEVGAYVCLYTNWSRHWLGESPAFCLKSL